jgi:hypothetical protein
MATNIKPEPWKSTWTSEKKDEFQYYKQDGTSITIARGTWISLPGRPDKVIVDKIYSLQGKIYTHIDNCGPCGISYLPWRDTEKRFATPSFSMRGNQRFIVCYPAGRDTFGGHIDWNNVEVCTPPYIANEDKEKFQEQVDNLLKPLPECVDFDDDEEDEN